MNVSEGRAITAMCLWEAWLELDNGEDEIGVKMADIRTNIGSWTVREMMLGLAEACDTAWEMADKLTDGDTGSFDWDFCPAFLRGVIETDKLDELSVMHRGRQMVAGDIGL